MSYSNIDVTTNNFITKIKINREKAFNALNEETIIELDTAVEAISKSQETKVVIISGAGSKAFIVGADITMFKGNSPIGIRKVILTLQALLNKIEDLKVTVIASINGFCLGGGLELAMACDLRIASENAKL